jgi:hypothetical protein
MIRGMIPDEDGKVYKGKIENIVFTDMGNALRATLFGKLDDQDEQRFLVTYTLYEDQPYVEISWGVDGKKPNPLPEAGWLVFPFKLDKPEYRLYRTGGIVDPRKDFVDRTNQDYYFLNTSMTLFDTRGSGAALNCPESPGISIDEPGLFKFSGKREPSTGKVYVNLFNTQWGTNFTEWTEGSFSSKVYLWSYKQYDSESSFITPSEETRVPLKGVFYEGPAGRNPLVQEGISLSRKGVLLTAFKKEGEGSLLRIWEQSGRNGACTISFPEDMGYTKAYPCNLRGEISDEQGIEILNHSFEVSCAAYQPQTYILK